MKLSDEDKREIIRLNKEEGVPLYHYLQKSAKFLSKTKKLFPELC